MVGKALNITAAIGKVIVADTTVAIVGSVAAVAHGVVVNFAAAIKFSLGLPKRCIGYDIFWAAKQG